MRLFPHQVEDLSTAIFCLSPVAGLAAHRSNEWPYRYVVLLWLSLITKIPFDLDRFDEAGGAGGGWVSASGGSMTTAQTLEYIGKKYLEYAGMEGVGASLLLAGLYTRSVLLICAVRNFPCIL